MIEPVLFFCAAKQVLKERIAQIISCGLQGGDCETTHRMIEPEFFFSTAKQVLEERMAQESPNEPLEETRRQIVQHGCAVPSTSDEMVKGNLVSRQMPAHSFQCANEIYRSDMILE
ncbi:hypothetical protein AKJ16_DCAP15894 [Drosera capensis]